MSFETDFRPIGAFVGENAALGDKAAIVCDERAISWRDFAALANRVANALRALGVGTGDKVAALAANSPEYVATYAGALRAGACVVPLSTMAAGDQLRAMIDDCDAKVLFLGKDYRETVRAFDARLGKIVPGGRIAFDFEEPGWTAFADIVAKASAAEPGAAPPPESDCNMIYSSGTTGAPKGIVHSQRMRWSQLVRQKRLGYAPEAVTLVSTPIYSNTTLVSLLPTLALGGTVILMRKFDARRALELCERHRVTHAMLVPVQYKRMLALADFDRFDLSAFKVKMSTSAPLGEPLKREIVARWPGRMIESYGLTEGGATFSLDCQAFPDKLHTVGRPVEGAEALIIDEAGKVLPTGQVGEVVGRSINMMTGYYKLPEKTAAMRWFHPDGRVFFRTGDMGRLDDDGFLILLDRSKDMIISGGFNVYPADIETELARHPAVEDSAVIGIPSEAWGESPLALVVRKPGQRIEAEELLAWTNARLGKTQRLVGVEFRDAFPRSSIGKILKRELRAPYWAGRDKAI